MKRILAMLMAVAMMTTMLVGTASAEAAELTYAEGTVLRMATGYLKFHLRMKPSMQL